MWEIKIHLEKSEVDKFFDYLVHGIRVEEGMNQREYFKECLEVSRMQHIKIVIISPDKFREILELCSLYSNDINSLKIQRLEYM